MTQYRYPPDYDHVQTDLAVGTLAGHVKVYGDLRRFVGMTMSPRNIAAMQAVANDAAERAEADLGSTLPGYRPVIRLVSDGQAMAALTLWEPV